MSPSTDEQPRVSGAAARLRADIDRGRTGDKVDWPDPAAAPLGTDDEAGGAPPDAVAIERARSSENARATVSPKRQDRTVASFVAIAFVVFAAVGVLALAMF